MILQIIHEFKATVHKKHVHRITTPREKEGRTINIFINIPEIPLRKVILRNGCHGLSPLDIKSLDTNINNNEKNQFERHYKSYRVGWLHDEVINSIMFSLTKDFTDTIYCASSEALLIAHGKSFGRLWKNINLSIVKKIFILFNPDNLHWVLIYIDIEKERSYLIDPINETNELYRILQWPIPLCEGFSTNSRK